MTRQISLGLQLRDLERKLEATLASVSETANRLNHPLKDSEDLALKISELEESRDLWFGKVADLEAANKRLEDSSKYHSGDMENARKIIIGLRSQLADLLKTDQEPVSAQFFDAGLWYHCQNEEHLRNTEAAGYVIRYLYDRPTDKPKKPRKNHTEKCLDKIVHDRAACSCGADKK